MGWQSKVYWANVVIMPYFLAIGQAIADILRFNSFSNGSRSPSWIFDIRYYNGVNMAISVIAPNYVLSDQTVMDMWPFLYFSIMAAIRQLAGAAEGNEKWGVKEGAYGERGSASL